MNRRTLIKALAVTPLAWLFPSLRAAAKPSSMELPPSIRSGQTFQRGQSLERGDLAILLKDKQGTPTNAHEVSYALYDVTTGQAVLLGSVVRKPYNPADGEYYARMIVPLDANLGTYHIFWSFSEKPGYTVGQTIVQEFTVVSRLAAVSEP
jgi:hypothetical protein